METFTEYFVVIAIIVTTVSITWALKPMFTDAKK